MPQPARKKFHPPTGRKTIDEILDIKDADRCTNFACNRVEPSEYLTLPDYLHEALCKEYPNNNPIDQELALDRIIRDYFLGVLGYWMWPTRVEDVYGCRVSQCVITPDILATALHYWAKYPKFKFHDYLWEQNKDKVANHSREEEYFHSDTNDDDSLYEEESNNEEEEEEEEEEDWDSPFWDGDKSDSSESESDEDEEENLDRMERIRDFCMIIQEYCDRDMAKNLTKEQKQRIDDEVAPGQGKIYDILTSHPTRTGGEMFDKLYPIPSPEFCIDPFEMLPFFRGCLLHYFGRICMEPILTLEAACILTKAISAVLFKFYFETFPSANEKKQQQTIKRLQEEIKNLKQQQLNQNQQLSAVPADLERENRFDSVEESSKDKEGSSSATSLVEGKTNIAAAGNISVESDDGLEANAKVGMVESSNHSKKRKLGSD